MALFAHLPFLNHLNRVDTWKSTAKECLELYRALGDKYIEADLLLMSTDRTSDATQRKELFQQVIQLAQASGDIWMQARTLRQAGWNSSGDERVAYWEQALTLFRQSGDWHSLGACLYQTGNFALLQGNVELAEKCLAEATFLNEELQDKESQAGILHVRAQIALVRGDYNQSHVYLQQELGILEEFGTYMQSLWSRSHLGYLALREGNLAEAHDIFTQNVQEFFEDKIEIGIVFNLEGVAGLFVAMGKPESAARVLGWADATRKRINDTRPRLEQADVDKIIAACLAKMGEAAFAEAYEEGQKMTMDEAVELGVRK
jgi:tetratricopeptide (TPR) repeat protein